MTTNRFEASPPIGLEEKWEAFVFNRYYGEIGYLGTTNVGKTNAISHRANFLALNYPGINILMFRGEGSVLRKTTIQKTLDELAPVGLDWEDKQQLILKWPTIDGKTSRIYGMGLNTGDFRQKLKTYEFGAALGDETDECIGTTYPGEKLDFILTRLRQKVYHRQNYYERIEQMVAEGNPHFSTFEDGLDYFAILEAELAEYEKLKTTLQYVANDEGNNWLWNRLVNYYGTKPHPPKDMQFFNQIYGKKFTDLESAFKHWIHENVGATEIHVPPRRSPKFSEDSLVYVLDEPDESQKYGIVESLLDNEQVLKLEDGRTVTTQQVNLVLERYCLYAFMSENQDRNREAGELMYLADERMSDQYMLGLADVKTGLVHPEFSINVHEIPQAPIPPHWVLVIQLDYNPNLVCATFKAISPVNDRIIFEEYEGLEGDVAFHAFEIRKLLASSTGKLPKEHGVVIIADPSLWHPNPLYPNDPKQTVAYHFEKVFARRMHKANNDRAYGLERIKSALMLKERVTSAGIQFKPELWVMDNCQITLNGSENNRGLSNMTYEIWQKKRLDHIHDTIRYGEATPISSSYEQATRKPPKSQSASGKVVWRRDVDIEAKLVEVIR